MSAQSQHDSRSPSPKRKTTATQQPQPHSKIGAGFSGLSSPKFSFRAALVQHKASKLASKSLSSGGDTSVVVHPNTVSQDSKLVRPVRSATSSIPSLSSSARSRVNSTTADNSTLSRRRNQTPETSRASSSLGKRGVDEVSMGSVSDFGALLKPNANAALGSLAGMNKAASTTAATRSKLPGPPSARSQWNATGSIKAVASPSTSKAPRKVARSESVAEVHATSPNTSSTVSPAETRITSMGSRSRTISTASARSIATMQRPKIGTLPKIKPKQVPVRTLLDERPQALLLSGMDEGGSDAGDFQSDESEEGDEEDEGDEEGLDVSRIRTKRFAGSAEAAEKAVPQNKMLPPSTTTASSRIPSIGSSTCGRAAMRPQRRSFSNNIVAASVGSEKENVSQIPSTLANVGSKRHSIGPGFGTHSRPRSSLPLAVTQPSSQSKAEERPREPPISANQATTPPPQLRASPTKTSLSVLRSRAQQPSKPAPGSNCADPRPNKQDLGIKSSIISANPLHPSILALQSGKATMHQPISTPEALIKAKKRLSGALLSSAGSSSSLVSAASAVGAAASPSETGSSLGRSLSVTTRLAGMQKKVQSTPRKQEPAVQGGGGMVRSGSRSPIKSSLFLFPTSDAGEMASPVRKPVVLPPTAKVTVSSSEIDATLLANLKVVASKANLNVSDLLHEEHQQQKESGQTRERARREASEELDSTFADVSVDLMALDLENSSPVSDMSMLRSPAVQVGYLDTPSSVCADGKEQVEEEQVEEEQVEGGEEEEVTDTSCASPSLRAAATSLRQPPTRFKTSEAEPVETPIRRGGGYRNVASIPSTPFPIAGSPSKCPPSAALSAKTRMRLKKALRESLGIEAHFATLNFNSTSANPIRDGEKEEDKENKQEDETRKGEGETDVHLRKSISTMLLTDDDKYLDKLVSAVARIGLEDLAPDQSTPRSTGHNTSPPTPHAHSSAPTASEEKRTLELQDQLSAALTELSTLRSALAASQSNTASLETKLEQKASAVERSTRTQQALETDLGALRAEMAGVEWEKARAAWGRARVEALAELEDVNVQADAMLVLGAQIGVWQRMVRASM